MQATLTSLYNAVDRTPAKAWRRFAVVNRPGATHRERYPCLGVTTAGRNRSFGTQSLFESV